MMHDEFGQPEDIGTLASDLATGYISSVPLASSDEAEDKAFIRHPAAYIYLAETYLKHEIATGNTNLKACKAKLNTDLFPGLTRYFKYADVKQNELIAASASAARETILADTLFARLCWPNLPENPYYTLDDVKKMVEQVILSTLNGDLPAALHTSDDIAIRLQRIALESLKANPADPDKEEQILCDINQIFSKIHLAAVNLRSGDEVTKVRKSLRKRGAAKLTKQAEDDLPHEIRYGLQKELHKAIDDLLHYIPLPERDIASPAYAFPIQSFVAKRQDMTSTYNRYQSELEELRKKTDIALERNHLGTDDKETLETLRDALEKRTQDVEAFRNGYLTSLPPQPEIFNHCHLKDKGLRAIFLSANATRLVNEIPASMRNALGSKHPLLQEVEIIQSRALNTLTTQTAAYSYLTTPPKIDFIEFGKKSWRRTIEKLVYEKNCDWTAFTDLSRINPLFSRPEMIYRYNKILRRKLPGLGWEMHPAKATSPYRDKGMKVMTTGSPNWMCAIQAGKVVKGIPWGVEIKLDDAYLRQFEPYHHQIYECIRLLEGGNRGEVDFTHLGDTFPRFIRETDRIVEMMYQHAENLQPEAVRKVMLLPEVQERMKQIHIHASYAHAALKSDTDWNSRNKVLSAHVLRDKLEELHDVICFAAARTASPATAAFYDHAMRKTFPQLENPEQCKELPKQVKLYMQYGPYELLKETENRKHVVYARLLDEDYQRSYAKEKEKGAARGN